MKPKQGEALIAYPNKLFGEGEPREEETKMILLLPLIKTVLRKVV